MPDLTTANYLANSMTAFARTQEKTPFGEFSWEVRSVNQRYLEINPRLPDGYHFLEPTIRNHVKQHLSRGKVDITLQLDLYENTSHMQIDQGALQSLSNAIHHVQQTLVSANQINPLEVLKWPGVLQESRSNNLQEAIEKPLLTGLDNALKLFCEHRLREGQSLALMIMERCDTIATHLAQLEPQLAEIVKNHGQKLKKRIADLHAEIDEQRFHQELALLAQKADITEEIDRIKVHLAEVRHILSQPRSNPEASSILIAPIGRRLDFLMQELNREANTLGSKAIDTLMSQTSVELKVLIEQMREQVQNIE